MYLNLYILPFYLNLLPEETRFASEISSQELGIWLINPNHMLTDSIPTLIQASRSQACLKSLSQEKGMKPAFTPTRPSWGKKIHSAEHQSSKLQVTKTHSGWFKQKEFAEEESEWPQIYWTMRREGSCYLKK